MSSTVFEGCMPALMTPCDAGRRPDLDALVTRGRALIDAGMSAVVYCGSMGEWPLLLDADRQAGVEALVEAGLPVVVGTGAASPAAAVAHAAHAHRVGARGLMLLPRVLSRGSSPQAQRAHFAAVLQAAQGLPAVIYNSPYYGFETGAELFFSLRERFPNLVGFKEFGGAAALRRAAEHITHAPDLVLMVGVDTQVFNGYVHCGATGAITGIGNVLPEPVLRLVALCERAAAGDDEAGRLALELERALHVLSSFDEGPDLVMFYKHLMSETGHAGYARHLHEHDTLSASQSAYAEAQLEQFLAWWQAWPGRVAPGEAQERAA